MVILGIILLILGWVLDISILVTIGIIVLVIGLVLLLLGGHQPAGAWPTVLVLATLPTPKA